MRALVLVLEHLTVLLDGQPTEKVTYPDVLHISSEALILVADLESQLTGVAHHNDGDLSINRFKLLEGGDDKDSGFAHARLGLADNVHAEDGLRNALVLHCIEIINKKKGV